ncbi:hypothetical protein Cl131_gp108 [Aphanizomenon phage vB_AphaS-CL131]|nr:hypothetical protein Cl131_gp108 [Aphanizomenon phage vB_AphaS-CL131]
MTNPFATRKEAFSPLMNAERWLMGMVAASAITGTFAPVMFPQQLPEVKLIQSIWGLVSGGIFTASALDRSQKEKDYQAIGSANHAIVKESLKGEFAFEQARQQINSKRELAAYVNELPMEERGRWMQQYGLQGLVELPQIQEAVIEQPRQLPSSQSSIPNPEIASFNEDAVQAIINPGVMAVLQELAAEHPEYIRIDDQWLDELCDSSALQNMSDRANHHFGLWGETQSGKSTLAGVIINKIAAQSQGAAYVIGSDPKNFVTRWLCKFSKKFEGLESLPEWIKFATKIIDERQQQFEHNRKGAGLSEIFLVQDEVNVVFGGGKGLPGTGKKQVTKETAVNLQGMWNYVINFTAAMKIHGIFMGQNPLSGCTGFSRPSYKNICFIALGKVSSYILSNPSDFLNVKTDILDLLKEVCELLDKEGVRYALVIPTRGNPYIALIPVFNIDDLEQSQELPHTSQPTAQDNINPYQIIGDWIEQLDRNPTDSELIQAWKEVTGIALTSDALQLLKNNLELTEEDVTWFTITANLELPDKWREEDLQKAIASRLAQHGYKVQTEVKCNGGFIDIATDFDGGTIIEVKKYLNRDTIYQAAGQLHLYGIGNEYKLLAMGFLPSNEGDQAQARTTASMVSQDERISCLFIE